ncbi:hypothetical protein M407DRAFT_27308 [Tulasnella calospora MUT 4182]|uniref:F-box domain-containing protein n=1 Tax=Tulasnella calospora MUT 4182 TaxID=1051891 RepID=A0A0C3LP85_9AGAM|nr:hypothetical protein M407DRAFT_33314 [Tulasnella calospora MUT 4182]KIO23237.1 hypothetical protein M407DRAFT_27308 [Tulasnella calospora MUT 4182]
MSFLKTPSRPLNDALPPEILAEIFRAVIFKEWDLSYRDIERLSLVCRSWRDAGRGMELLAIGVSAPKYMDALLGHIHTTPLFRESNRAKIHSLSATADKEKDFHRLPELLTLCRASLRRLHLTRLSFDDPEVELFHDTRVEAPPDFYLPNLTFLHHTLTEELTSLRFLDLKEIEIVGRFRAENPILTWLCQIAPNLETLEFSTVRDRLPLLTELMGSNQILKKFQKLKLWIRIRYEDLDPYSPDLAALIEWSRSGDGRTGSASVSALDLGCMKVEREDNTRERVVLDLRST